MKGLVSVVLIAFVAQASAQLRCYECVDCPHVEEDTHLRDCYGPVSDPTLQTNPTTVSLTAATEPGVVGNWNQPSFAPNMVDEYISPARQNPLFNCFTIRSHIGDRNIVHRGCALIHQNDDLTCRHENQGEDPDFCYLCNEDDCNDSFGGASAAIASIVLISFALFVALRLY